MSTGTSDYIGCRLEIVSLTNILSTPTRGSKYVTYRSVSRLTERCFDVFVDPLATLPLRLHCLNKRSLGVAANR